MTFPTYDAVTVSGTTGAESTTVDYATTVPEGALNICLWANDGGSNDLPTWPAGDWADNEMYQLNHLAVGTAVSYRFANASDGGGSFSVAHPNEGTTAVLIQLTGHHASTPPEISARVTDNVDDWNETTLTPSGWDASAEDTLWIAVQFHDNGTVSTSSYPTNFTDNQRDDVFSAAAGVARIASASRSIAAATQTPAEVFGALSGNEENVCVLIAVRPAGAASSNTDILVPTGPWR